MALNPPEFEGIELNTRKRSTCTPKVNENFRGIQIVSPTRIELKGETLFPVCGTLRADVSFLHKFYSFSNEIMIVAMDAKTHQSYTSNLMSKGSIPSPGSPLHPSAEGFDTAVFETWFNVDLFRYIIDLPLAPARYYVFAYLGEMVSNLVTVDVSGKGDNATRYIGPGQSEPTPRPDKPYQLDVKRSPNSPTLESGFRGIKLALVKEPNDSPESPLWLYGAVQLDATQVKELGVTPIHKAIVITTNLDLVYFSSNLVGEKVLFPDDQETAGDIVRAYFRTDVPAHYKGMTNKTAYIVASIGPFVSNVVAVSY